MASRLVVGPWNGLRTVAARSWPVCWTGDRHATCHRLARAVWSAWVIGLLGVAVVLALAAVAVWPVWWLVGNTVAVGLVLAGWTPATYFDPVALDPERALFDDDAEHRRPTPPPSASPPARRSCPPPPAPTPGPVSLEERQVAAAEANAAALHRLALAETQRPAPAPAVTWHHQRTGPSRAKRFLLVVAGIYVVFFLLLAAGYLAGPPADPIPELTGEPTP
jgi:hypothetical protein